MKEEEKTREKAFGFIVAGVLVSVFVFASIPAQANFILDVGYYDLRFGKINEYFDEKNDFLGTDFEFKPGMMYGLGLRYEVTPHFRLILEHSLFESQTSSGCWVGQDPDYWSGVYKLTIAPVVLSGTYKFSPFYIGAGVGSFHINFIYTHTYKDYQLGDLVNTDSESGSDNNSSASFVLLAGFEFGDRPIFFNLEARYIVDTKGKLELGWLNTETEVDLCGWQVNLLAGFNF